MADVDYTQLEKRLGKQLLARRLKIQSHHVVRLFGAGRARLHIGNIRILHRIMRRTLKVLGIYRIGYRNAMNLRVEQNEVFFSGLPQAFDGFRILHISDAHIDDNPKLLSIIQDKAGNLDYDICVFTGDFREGTFEDYRIPSQHMAELVQNLNAPVYAVLGNHDCIEMVPLLESAGIRILLNERVVFERGKASLYLLGVDDPHYYETDDLEKATEGMPNDAFCILLAHSPQIIRKAAFSGVDFYLCGHTHGGQTCLPGGHPILANSRCRKDQRKGAWKYHRLQGYTSRGAGTSSVNVRFNCPPEITVHTLRCK
ncbi:metallophosphoesterase [Tichowtungia aerotolerans]|uniref:Metallophosphoesterase n=1 Tax=Tichowtungia aerotolerans TaxID=2697043 RepID=A0A6P1MCL8_9BACT|nr:metallophosphoesterase [Tichowtungia aerotolerans]QHI69346.1 metallophosphoesterase [Tichowtungia aerotolerans]